MEFGGWGWRVKKGWRGTLASGSLMMGLDSESSGGEANEKSSGW